MYRIATNSTTIQSTDSAGSTTQTYTFGTNLFSAGSITVFGSDFRGKSISESKALTEILSSAAVEGSKIFGSISKVSIVATLATSVFATGTATVGSYSNMISFSVGQGGRIGLPTSMKKTSQVASVWIGAERQTAWTVHTGDFPAPAVSLTGYNNASAVMVYRHHSAT
jgi:hypothetical protein